jgi:spore coat protein CotH
MPSKSERQRNFFRLVKAYKSGKIKNVSDEIKKAANSMSNKQIDDFLKLESEGFPQANLGNTPGMGDVVAPNALNGNTGSGDVFTQTGNVSVIDPFKDIDELLQKIKKIKEKIKRKN